MKRPRTVPQPKRRHESSDNPILSRPFPAPVGHSEGLDIDALPSTPLAALRLVDDLPLSPPGISYPAEQHMTSGLALTPGRVATQSPFPTHGTTSPTRPTSGLMSSPRGLFLSEPSFP
jgi:hypothetical protein